MKRIGITQRVDIISSYGERRDALDQQWYKLLLELNILPIPLPNISPEFVSVFVDDLRLDGVLLTGGNSLSHLDFSAEDKAPERDAFELALLSYAEKKAIPVFGICRGMQVINHYFGGGLVKVEGHIAQNHKLISLKESIPLPSMVNSYHSWAVPNGGLANVLDAIAVDEAGNIEAFSHKEKKIAGIGWHPEREIKFNILDLNFIKSNFYD